MAKFVINYSSEIEKYLENKKVLYIPVISMRSRITGLYDLAADGNVNRFLSKFSQCKNLDVDITISVNSINTEFLKEHTYYKNTLTLLPTVCYGNNAKETRKNPMWLAFLGSTELNNYDVIIFEPNIIGLFDFKEYKGEVLYWMPVSSVKDIKIPFIDEFYDIDIKNVNKYKTFVASKYQQKLFPTTILDNNLFNLDIFLTKDLNNIDFEENIIFIPFRQSDIGYNVKYIYEVLEKIKRDFVVFYTAPNDFELEGNFKKLKVSKHRDTYYSILRMNPIIVYLENPDVILHISLLEFLHFESRLVYFKNSLFSHKDKIGEINNLSQVKEKIEYFLK